MALSDLQDSGCVTLLGLPGYDLPTTAGAGRGERRARAELVEGLACPAEGRAHSGIAKQLEVRRGEVGAPVGACVPERRGAHAPVEAIDQGLPQLPPARPPLRRRWSLGGTPEAGWAATTSGGSGPARGAAARTTEPIKGLVVSSPAPPGAAAPLAGTSAPLCSTTVNKSTTL